MARPAPKDRNGGVAEGPRRLSIMFSEPMAGIAGGIAATSYGGIFLILLVRGAWNPVPDLLSFALYTGVTLTGLVNVVRWAPAARSFSIALLGAGYLLVMAGWAYVSARYSTPLTGGEGLIYGMIAAAALAAVIDDVRLCTYSPASGKYRLRWLMTPAAAFAAWSLFEIGGLPSGLDWLAVVGVVGGLPLISLGYLRSRP